VLQIKAAELRLQLAERARAEAEEKRLTAESKLSKFPNLKQLLVTNAWEI